MTATRERFTFEDVLPRLVTAYESGRLVPFIGAGMSCPHCAGWSDLIAGLEGAAEIHDRSLPGNMTSDNLIQRANRAVRTLRARKEGAFESALEGTLFPSYDKLPPDGKLPRQTEALARIWWPLVLTTNYDDFYVKAFDAPFDARALAVVGRGPEDCQRVLTSLSTAGRALLWALQGHIAAPCRVAKHEEDRRLAKELVIDHAEYRRVTHREPHFRRAFAEVFRHRSLLFLGSGLREAYLQELFGEVLELYGPSTRTHYALMKRGEVDPRFMYARFQIAVVEYDHHDDVPDRLDDLGEAIKRSEAAPVSWSWGRAEGRESTATSDSVDLEIVCRPLPQGRVRGECLVVSAGGRRDGDSFHVSDQIRRPTLESWCKDGVPQPRKLSAFVGEYVGCDVFAVRARREDEDVKDLLMIREASRALFDEIIARRRYRSIHMQLIATGGTDETKADEPRWRVRSFPARFSFVETVRAWGERSDRGEGTRLVLHVVNPSVYREIVSGRIDVLELLQCKNNIRFWAEVAEGGTLLERRQFLENESMLLESVADELCLTTANWSFDVSPPTGIVQIDGLIPLDGQDPKGNPWTQRSLRELGVVPGSTLHFRRRP